MPRSLARTPGNHCDLPLIKMTRRNSAANRTARNQIFKQESLSASALCEQFSEKRLSF
jgi:hypothetical protein